MSDPIAAPVALEGVLLGREGARMVAALLERYRRTEGVPFSPAAARLHAACTAAASGHRPDADWGHGDVPNVTDTGSSASWITVSDAAGRLGLSRRQVSRLAADGILGPSRVHAGSRWVRPEEVAAYAAEQEASA